MEGQPEPHCRAVSTLFGEPGSACRTTWLLETRGRVRLLASASAAARACAVGRLAYGTGERMTQGLSGSSASDSWQIDVVVFTGACDITVARIGARAAVLTAL